MASIFTKIISGEIPSYKIAENDDFLAFLDAFPLVEGHVLIVPKMEVDNIFDVDDSLLSNWLVFARPVAKAIEAAFACKRCGISVIGLEVPHAHMHLLPINTADDLNFTRPKLQLDAETLQRTRQAILDKLNRL